MGVGVIVTVDVRVGLAVSLNGGVTEERPISACSVRKAFPGPPGVKLGAAGDVAAEGDRRGVRVAVLLVDD